MSERRCFAHYTTDEPPRLIRPEELWLARSLRTKSTLEHRAIKLKGRVYDRVPYKPDDPEYLCVDCEAAEGDIHELGCDAEECPRCGEQLISCGCLPIPD